MNKTEQHKKAIIEALEKSLGVVSTACKTVGVGRTTFYGWLKDDPEFAQQVDDIQNIALDFVESKLFENIKQGKTSEMIFYLKTKGKKRGYIERQEITGADGTPTNFQIEIIGNTKSKD
jgi:predicted DNA-binding transcriptional regulator AlpA